MENKIPKIIHYCWFGNKEKPKMVLDCIESWRKVMPDYEIKEWNENNFDINFNDYTKKAYQEKKWAFISDVARLVALKNYGGIYLDTDMYILKRFDDFLYYDLVLGKEDEKHISAGMIANIKNSFFIEKVINYYNNTQIYETIPRVLTKIYDNLNVNEKERIKVFSKDYFYPFSADNIKDFNYHNAPKESYAVHLWNYSWGNPLNKFLKKAGLHKIVKTTTEKLGIKKIIKRILKMA